MYGSISDQKNFTLLNNSICGDTEVLYQVNSKLMCVMHVHILTELLLLKNYVDLLDGWKGVKINAPIPNW